MDRNNIRSTPTPTTTPTVTTSQIYPFLLGHHLSAYSNALSADGTHHNSSTSHLAGTHLPFISSSDGEDDVLPRGFDPAALVYENRANPPEPEPELDGYDCESEEGVEVSEEPGKPSVPRGSGSKRSRAAEVHNLSEKRRRSRINEKMKALQKLIPNSNKTDKASMLDEAIDYLKQLQLQVQMLSRRNGLTLNPPCMPPTLQSLQASQMRFGSDSASFVNIGMGMVSLDPPTSSSFGLPNCGSTSSHQNLVPGTSNVSDPVASFAMGSSHSQHGFLHLPAVTAGGIYPEESIWPHLNPSENIRSASLHFEGQPLIPNADRMDESCILNRLSSQEGLPMDRPNSIHAQHMQHG